MRGRRGAGPGRRCPPSRWTAESTGSRRRAGRWAEEIELLLAERDRSRRSDVAVELPTHLSASRLVRLAEDPAALAADLRRPMPRPPAPEARRGTAFHAWVEQRFGAAAMVDVLELPGAADEGPAADDRLPELQANFLASEWADRKPVAIEVAIETPVAGTVLRGRIDAVFPHRPTAAWTSSTGRPGPSRTGRGDGPGGPARGVPAGLGPAAGRAGRAGRRGVLLRRERDDGAPGRPAGRGGADALLSGVTASG